MKLFFAWAGLLAGALVANAAGRPNIVFILADDLGYSDSAVYGSQYYETPNIDRLAREGLKFSSGYTCGPNCQPTRAALMSGQYMPRTGIYTVGGIDRFNWQSRPLRPVENVTKLPLGKITIAESLKKAGYVTGLFGKWHLGNEGPYHPGKRGFDEAIESSGVHFDFKTDPPVTHPQGQYLADFLTDQSLDFIRRHKDEPFFLYLSHFAVHGPHQAKPELIAKFKEKPPAGGHQDPTYAAMIYSVDECVGRIVALLDGLKLSENTLVIFSSDNGGVGGYARDGLRKANAITDNAPLRGGKGMLYEGGIRVPFIFRWPGQIAAGTSCDEPISSVDLYPTFLEIAGATPPPNDPLDGFSFLNLLTGGKPGKTPRAPLFWHFPGYVQTAAGSWLATPASAIRSGDWKLLEFFEDSRVELYNLRDDLGETNNLATSQPAKANELREKLIAWRKKLHAPMPTANTNIINPTPGGKRPVSPDTEE
jgi:arylsulfatase A-like enzyme